ncbi:MAG: hypothetical protein A2097_04045 [Desulfobacula sp. GWF2_41_7]|nr:MAG: hypothetical protein A2097_04045 [Desulfobacula sp. GWF2_41_7]
MSSDESILTHPLSRLIYYLLLSTIPFYYWRQAFPVVPFDWFLAFILMIIILIHLVITKRLPEAFFNNLNIWFILFFLINLISSLFSEYRDFALSELFVLFQGYVFIIINLFFLDRKSLAGGLPMALGLSIGLNSLIASLGYFFGMTYMNTWEGHFRTLGVTLGSNTLSLMCVFIIPILVYAMINAKSAGSFFSYMFLVFINVCGLVSSESRGGFLHLLIISMMMVFFNRQRFQPRFFGIAISFLAFAVLVVGVAIPDSYFERQKTLLSEEQDTSFRRRAAYIKVGLDSFMENPIFGKGTGTFPKIWVKSKEVLYFKITERPTHNTYLDVLVSTGIIGLLIFLGLMFQVFKDISRSIQLFDIMGDDEYKTISISYMLAFLITCSYGLIKNLLDFKLFILVISLSQVIYLLSMREKGKSYELD